MGRVCVVVCAWLVSGDGKRELAKSADSNLGAVHVKHLVRPANNQTSLLEMMFLLCRVKTEVKTSMSESNIFLKPP